MVAPNNMEVVSILPTSNSTPEAGNQSPSSSCASHVDNTNEMQKKNLSTITNNTIQSTPDTPFFEDEPCTTPPLTFSPNNNTDNNITATEKQSLEERVVELETKLATMSRLLQRQSFAQASTHLCFDSFSLPSTPPQHHHHLTRQSTATDASVPALDSPFPEEQKLTRRTLSCKILQVPNNGNDNFASLLSEAVVQEQTIPSSSSHQQKTPISTKTSLETIHSVGSECPVVPNLIETSNRDPQQKQLPPENKNIDTKTTTNENAETTTSKPRSDSITSSAPDSRSIRQKWMDYLESFQESNHDVDMQMEEFVRVPSQLEHLLGFGFAICVDSFLYVLTMLPLKCLWSLVLFVLPVSSYKFHRRHFYTLLQVTIIYMVYNFVLMPMSIGKLYHWIRSQAMLKLYVLIAMVEVFDRLMCSLGQDSLDSMYWNTTRRPRSARMLVSVAVVLVYAMCHTLILFVHVATLNVAINSADQALLSLLIGGNFAEIKSTVFKKYNRPNLFKITASDICERFKLALFLTLVFLLNLCQGMDGHQIWGFFKMCGIVWCAEMCSDWIKHSFITKFNYIPSKVYAEYALLLAGDVTGIGHEEVNLDHSHAVVKRLGFAQIPLVCVLLRMMQEAARYYSFQYNDESTTSALPNGGKIALIVVCIWAVLFGIKVVLGRYLQAISQQKLEAAPPILSPPNKKVKKA